MTIITPFSPEEKNGGGFISRMLIDESTRKKIKIRSHYFIIKLLWALLGVMLFPFIHPIFTRYVPIATIVKNRRQHHILNFSQTFSASLLLKNTTLVCHDLQCHKDFKFKHWVRISEKTLLSRATNIIVLSSRDAKILRRFYGVNKNIIFNLGEKITSSMPSFRKKITGPAHEVVFLGSLDRKENKEGVLWFANEVLPHCKNLKLSIIGATSNKNIIHHPKITYLGFIKDLSGTLRNFDMAIAPLFSEAGIKIKVIEIISEKNAVLGTTAAFSGISKPSRSFISNNPEDWVKTLNNGGLFLFPRKTEL